MAGFRGGSNVAGQTRRLYWDATASMATVVLLTTTLGALADLTTFSGTGNWDEPGRWDVRVPLAGDDAIIDGDVTLTNTTPVLRSYVLNNTRTHTFVGTNTVLRATNVTVSGTMTHSNTLDNAAPWELEHRVYIEAYNNVTIGTTGKINVDGKGYQGAAEVDGYGPGGVGTYISAAEASGSGYGGQGGFTKPQYDGGDGGPTYGLASAPEDPGSGGANSINNFGGGVVRITADGAVTVDGSITADGVFVSTHGAGAGSGGAIFITCGTFTGSGLVSADGGRSSWRNLTGGGGGGRVAIVYTNAAAQSSSVNVRFTLAGGSGNPASEPDPYARHGDMGTLHLSGSKFLPTETLTGTYHLSIPSFTAWSPASLTVTNGRVRLPDGIDVTTAGNVAIGIDGILELREHAALHCGGDLGLTGGGSLYVYAGPTNAAPPDHGALIAVTGVVTVASGSTIYPYSHPTNGGSVLFTADSFNLAAGAMIDANIKGYQMGDDGSGYGPGGGEQAANWGEGGSYGGKGGLHDEDSPYGITNAPIDPGSGGGSTVHAASYGGKGGGLIRISCPSGTVTVDGAMRANGGNSYYHASGGGSGGGVHIDCSTIAGSGVITANGGNGTGAGSYGGGGGGRVALTYSTADPNTAIGFALNGGTGIGSVYYYEGDGRVGTLYLSDDSFFPSEQMMGGGRFVIPGVTNWTASSLTLTNGRVRFPDGFLITVSNDVTLADAGVLDIRNHAVLDCGGNMLLTNGAELYAYSGATNGATTNCGVSVHIAGELTVATNCAIYPNSHRTDGGAPYFEVGSLTVAHGAAIDADGGGYQANGAGYPGSGPGGGANAQGGNYGAGGGYGGRGGDATNATIIALGGSPYGSIERPMDPGSAGANDNGDGGGLIRIKATPYTGVVTIDGLLTADGEDGSYHGDGGGSGGGIYIDCATFEGAGEVSAKGGTYVAGGGGHGGGGGGRIAIWSIDNLWAGTALQTNTTVGGGLGDPTYGYDGDDGTIYWGLNPPPPGGTVFLLH